VQHTDQLTPLNNLVDAVYPDPPSRHWFELTVKRLLADPNGDTEDRAALDAQFTQLTDSVHVARQQMFSSPRLTEASMRADQLLQLTAMGQEALQYLARRQKAPTAWTQKQLETLEQIRNSNALVRFTFLSPMGDLIRTVSN
jgi:hexosaminidase